jgi:hypothetical protein
LQGQTREIRLEADVISTYLDLKEMYDFFDKIRNSKSGDALYNIHPMLRELEDINDYSKKFHHDQNPGADSENVNDIELKSYSQRAIKIIQN